MALPRILRGYTATTNALICTKLSCLVLRDNTSGLRNATYFSKALNFCYFLFKQKVREKIIQPVIAKKHSVC
jgi:hypothetical protein